MKIRTGFVSNSSSSSFILASTDNDIALFSYGETPSDTDTESFDIDEFIEMLTKAKEDGAKKVYFEYGGGYDS